MPVSILLLCLLLTSVQRSEWITPPSVLISKDTVQISQGKTRNFRCINAGFIKHTPIADGGLYGHVPTRPGCTTPQIRFLYVALHLWIGLPCLRQASFRPHLAMTPPAQSPGSSTCPFYSPWASSYPSALRIPGVRTCTSLATCHARHTRLNSAAGDAGRLE